MAATLPTIADRLPQLITVADQLQTLLNSPEVTALMGSGIFSPQTVAVVAHAGDALVESYNANQTAPKQVGLFGLLRALGDPDVFLPTDIGVRNALRALGHAADPKAAMSRATRWQPWRSYALHHLWASLNDLPSPNDTETTR
mgnify:CR=1 FL=1